MVNTFGNKTDFVPWKKLNENKYLVQWNCKEDIIIEYQKNSEGNLVLDEQGNPIPTGNTFPSDMATWTQEVYNFKPSLSFLKNEILEWYNRQTDYKILTGFVWKNMSVWLSMENQFNYKAMCDITLQTNGANLPVTLKFGTMENPQYYEFKIKEDVMDFYSQSLQYINNTIQDGWQEKDAIDWTQYEITE